MESIEYDINDYEVVYEEDKNNFIEYIKGTDEYLIHCRYDGGDQIMGAKSIHQALIIMGLLKYGYSQKKISMILEIVL